jgi:ribose transport system permease protein
MTSPTTLPPTTGDSGAERAPVFEVVPRKRDVVLRRLVRFQSVFGLVLVFVGGVIFSPNIDGRLIFLSPDNLANIVRAVSETGIIAVGMTFVIIAGGIDLSVGAVLGLAGVTVATLMVNNGFDSFAAIGLVLIVGLTFGILQGLVSTKFGIQAFIATLAGMQVARGLARLISNDQFININYGAGPGTAPESFSHFGDRIFGVIPVSALIFIGVSVIGIVVLNTTRFGRHVFAVGGNERAARLSGVNVRVVKIATFAICGLLAALAGIVHAGQLNFASPDDGVGFELTAIAAVVIGGTSLFGGSGTVVGTIAGSLLLGALNNILQLNNVNPDIQLIATGLIVAAAAALQTFVRRRREV